jgi:hypothetical protein
MRRLFRQLERLERRTHPTGMCQCAPPDVSYRNEGEPDPVKRACPSCGREREVIDVVYVNLLKEPTNERLETAGTA